MAAELDVFIKYWRTVSLSAVFKKRFATIQPMIVDVDDNNEQAVRLLVELLRLNIKLLKTNSVHHRLSNEIYRKRSEL